MTDRRRRAALLLPPPALAGRYPEPGTAPGVVLLPRGRTSSSSGPSSPDPDRDNPFAPPPPGTPDQDWRPRHPSPYANGQDQEQGPGRSHGEGPGEGEGQGPDDPAPSWGSQWSPRQPGRQNGGFGSRPGGRNGQSGGGPGGPGGPGNLRWDPTDPAQRRARYALLAGMWAFFFVLFSLSEVALLLGSLAIYWGISALRAKPDPTKAAASATTAAMEGRPAPHQPPAQGPRPGGPGATRPQVTSAVAGLVTASLALMLVAATFTVQIVYRDYFTCVNDALTQSSGKTCEKLLPKELRPLLSVEQP
ncbi:hypothetical protein [Streptomyces sp. NPDC059649]|uniref:hypothetical protein n=1 Tax=Streptomyces sp. NPDC059649 TaxID=3346895 RepID=UPI0036A8FE8E